MTVGRNDPCPCGSGKKYKKCCLSLDRQAGANGSQAGEVRAVAGRASEWQADIVALPATIEGDAASRLAVLLVVANGYVIHSDALDRPSPEAEAMAELLAPAIRAAAARLGHLPERVIVRDEEIAAALGGLLAEGTGLAGSDPARPPEVVAEPLPELDEAAYSLAEHSTGRRSRYLVSCPDTWAGWDLPAETVVRLFRLAAAFYRAAPWTTMTNLGALEVVAPSDQTWTVCVLGNGRQEFGMALYADAGDFWSMASGGAVKPALWDPLGRVVSINFDAGGDLPKAMRREVAGAGWEVASPAAYPRIFAINTPAGGVRRRDAEDLAALLAAVPRFVAAHAEQVKRHTPVEGWRDEETGVVLSYSPAPANAAIGGVWPEVGDLAPGWAEGPGAEPAAAVGGWEEAVREPTEFRERELVVVDRFAAHLAEREGLAASTVQKHAGNAATFVGYLADTGVPVRAVHEYDLRVFLFDRYPRKGGDGESRMKTMPGSLQRFFDYLADEEGIVCRWAAAILADRDLLSARWEDAPLGPFWETEVGEWRADHDDDLNDRLMLPDSGLGDDEEWGAMMGSAEAQVYQEAQRRWLLWRDEALSAGAVEWEALARHLIARQQEWAKVRRPDLGGKSPLQVIRAERRRQGKHADMLDLLRRSDPPADEP
jgi:SEC-C motif/Domain of unknown function (DUF6930)